MAGVNGRIPRGAPVGRLLQVLAVGGAGVYGIANSLFNVEGGHRAIVFNRIIGLKEEVSKPCALRPSSKHADNKPLIYSSYRL